MIDKLNHKIFSINEEGFESLALEVFRFQYNNNELYRQFVDVLRVDVSKVDSIFAVPFLPIGFFKSHAVKTTAFVPEAVFESSSTTQLVPSRHYVKDVSLYKESFLKTFRIFYGEPEAFCIIGLLPSYLERKNSSLVMMVDEMISRSGHALSGFYLDEYEKLYTVLQELEKNKQKTILMGVSFGLLDFAEQYALSLQHTIVMETGGMKGRREELTRQQLHDILMEKLGVATVHSEYGMTELLSQAYSNGAGKFHCPPWMKILLREEDDPLMIKEDLNAPGRSGVINVIDLANINSCCFIATDDVGKIYADGSFEVLGRMDNSDIRGCSLMVV